MTEANAAVGRNVLSESYFGVDSKIQRKKLVFADRDQIFRDCMNYSHWKIDARIIRTLIDKSGDTVNWLMDRGVEFCDVVHHIPNQTPEVFHITEAEENVGHCVIRNLKRICEEKHVILKAAWVMDKVEGRRQIFLLCVPGADSVFP